VILYGPVGVGKSHVAQALGHLAIRHGADADDARRKCPGLLIESAHLADF
jgi:DNA replication protein DnaC